MVKPKTIIDFYSDRFRFFVVGDSKEACSLAHNFGAEGGARYSVLYALSVAGRAYMNLSLPLPSQVQILVELI